MGEKTSISKSMIPMDPISQMPSLVPELTVTNLKESLRFYLEVLGFRLEYERTEDKFASVRLEKSWIMLEEAESLGAADDREFVGQREWRTGRLEYPFGRGINFQIMVEDAAACCRSVLNQSYPIKAPLEERWYRVGDRSIGVRQFLLMDPDGYLLRIQQDIGVRSIVVV